MNTALAAEAGPVLAKAAWRLIPLMMLMYVASFLDRVNIGFAALQMNQDLGFTPEVFGFGAGIFFWGYFLFEMPSNLVMEKVGARLWMCRIMVSWGLLSMATAFVQGPLSFYAVRFLLGAAEAGLYPGMILYMTYWFPQSTRARFIALFLAAVPLSNVIGAPLSGWLLGIEGYFRGWQNMLLIEGIPSVLLGIAVLFFLPDDPEKARWLSRREKDVIAARLAQDRRGDEGGRTIHGLKDMLSDRRVWVLMIPDFCIVIALYTLSMWMPLIVSGLGFSSLQTGWLVSLAYLAAMAAMVALGVSSDRRGDRVWHVAFSAALGACGMAGAALLTDPVLVIVSFCVAACGIYAALAIFWTLPTAILRGTAAAGGIALINSVANLGGFFGPYLTGFLRERSGEFAPGLLAMAGMLVLAGVSVIWIGRAFFGRHEGARLG